MGTTLKTKTKTMAFKMKGPSTHKGTARHTKALKGKVYEQLKVNREMDNTSLPDGRPGSSSPAKIVPLVAMAGKALMGKVAGKAVEAVSGANKKDEKDSPNKIIGAVVGGLAKKALGGVAKKVGAKIAGSKIGKKVAGSKIGKAVSKASKIFGGGGEDSPADYKPSPAKLKDVIIDGKNIGTGKAARASAIAHELKQEKKFHKDRKDESKPAHQKAKLANIKYTGKDKEVMESDKGSQEYWEGERKADPKLRKYKTKEEWQKSRNKKG